MSTVPADASWFSTLLRTQQAMLGPFTAGPGALPAGSAALAGTNLLMAPWLQAASTFTRWQHETLQRMAAFWPMAGAAALPGFPVAADVSSDKRFSAQGWAQDPRYALLAQGYLAQAQALRQALESAPLDERTKAQWGFVLRQAIDAASPANCLLTNPEALQAAMDSGGASLMEGLRLFMEDFARGRVSMTDETAFEVGRNVALTPGQVVFENELFQLIQYAPTTPQVRAVPLLIVPPCINKFYILDLQPQNSLVAHAVGQGHTVFLVSWRNIDASLGHLTWDDYQQRGVLQALAVACDVAGSERANALGFCIGGTLLACTAAVMAAQGDDRLASLTLLTTFLDFCDTGELGLMVTPESMALREAAIGRGGVLHGRELAHMFAALRANDLIWPYVVNGYLKGQAPPPFDLLYWNADDSNLPGPMACWFMRNGYLDNRIREPGGTLQSGVRVDLRQVKVPAFVYASREDHIVPWKAAYASTQLLGGPVRFVLGASGHIAGVINPPAKNKRSHWVGPDDTHDANPQRWFERAEQRPGSWWPAWTDWLQPHAGEQVEAPATPGNARHPPIEPAPGRYVKAKAT